MPRTDTQCTDDAPIPLRIERASPSWRLIMQSGVGIGCTVGITAEAFLAKEMGLSPEQIDGVEALFLDGTPVDDFATAIVPDGARVALAAGLPGIAGLAMKKDSGVKVLRATITHFEDREEDPRPGGVTLILYSLLIPALAGHFLGRGVVVTAGQLRRYAGFAPDDMCTLGARAMPVGALLDELPEDPGTTYALTAIVKPDA